MAEKWKPSNKLKKVFLQNLLKLSRAPLNLPSLICNSPIFSDGSMKIMSLLIPLTNALIKVSLVASRQT
jgi:hypothetical protein